MKPDPGFLSESGISGSIPGMGAERPTLGFGCPYPSIKDTLKQYKYILNQGYQKPCP